MNSFEGLSLSQGLNKALKKIDFKEPTPIQAQAIPLAMAGKDILGSAQTGTGKTAAFSIPLIESILTSDTSMALVLTPTRELAKQVMEVITSLLSDLNHINTACLIGGEQMTRQLKQLKKKPRIIVGTPGRINDHLDRKTLKLNQTNYVVLDETDRMLDMGFSAPISKIFDHVAVERQTLLFSATLPKGIQNASAKYLNNPTLIEIGRANSAGQNIEQSTQFVSKEGKFDTLVQALTQHEESAIVFMNSKFATEKLAKRLNVAGISASAIHGDLRQNKRERVISGLRNNKFRVLVATDVAARGIDIPHIYQVINFDLPRQTEDYIHRIGRTGRNGAKGLALSLATNADKGKLEEIDELLGIKKANSAVKNGQRKSSRKKPPSQNRWRNKRKSRAKAA